MMEDNNTQLSADFVQPQPIVPGMEKKTPALLQRYTKEQIEEAIDNNYGITTAIAN